jgi:5,10-methenyltetrahydrofolate synthetase
MRAHLMNTRMADLQETKTSLRKRLLGRRDAIDPCVRTALSRAIVQDIVETSVYRRSNTVMAYASFGSELQTDDFVRHVLHQGKILLLPRVNRQKELVDVYRVRDPVRDLHAGTWGIREPRPDRCVRVDPHDIDFVLVPGLAYDARGGRLGYGGGFYDRLLADGLSSCAWLVAGAFEAQMVDKVPLDEHDVAMDVVVTESVHYPPGPLPRWASH